jgi:hypothetical protein
MTTKVAAVTLGITALIAIALGLQRAGVGSPFGIPVFRHLLYFQDYYAIAPFVGIVLAALLAPVGRLGESVALWCARRPWQVAALVVLALAGGTRLVYHSHPLSMDEYAVVFQGELFAHGVVAAQLPPPLLEWLVPKWMGEFFRINRQTGAVVSGYWPGFSLLLAPFSALGLPWLLNPLLGGATVLVVHRLALELFGNEESAGYAVLLTIASPAVSINAMSYYAMPAHLVANGLFMLLLLKATPARAFLAGIVGSFALVLHNPAPHTLFALPWIAWLAFRPDRMRLLPALLAGYAPLSLLLGWGWPKFIDELGRNAASGAVALGTLATPAEMGALLLQRLKGILGWRSTAVQGQLAMLYKLWLWAVPGLVAVAVLGAWRQRRAGGPWPPMIAAALLTYCAYFFIRFDQGHGWGARYFHAAWLALPLLGVAALQESIRPGGPPGSSRRLAPYLAGCAVLSLAVLTAFRCLQVEHFIARHLAQLPASQGGSPRVVIVNPESGYYAWDLPQNDPFLRRQPVALTSRDPQLDRAMMAEHFPQLELLASDRRGSVWGVRGP